MWPCKNYTPRKLLAFLGKEFLLRSLMALSIPHGQAVTIGSSWRNIMDVFHNVLQYLFHSGEGRESRAVLLCPAECSSQCITLTLSRLWIACNIYCCTRKKIRSFYFFLSGKPFLMGGQGCPKSNAISSGNFKEGDDYLQLTEDIRAGTLTPCLIDYPRFAQPQSSPGPQLNRCHG